jgi:hypothetical protein
MTVLSAGVQERAWSFDPTFHPTNVSTWGITGQHHSDGRPDNDQLDGTIQHHMDGLTSTHNP